MKSKHRIPLLAVAVALVSMLAPSAISGARAATTDSAGVAGPRLEGVPRYQHVFTIVLENENFSAAWGPGGPPYLQSLRSNGAFADNYYGISHVSADNYIAMTSGQPATPPFNGDCLNYAACETFEMGWPDGGRSIADQVDDTGLTWKAYMESMPGPCVHPAKTDPVDPYQTGYATRHDPFVYYPPVVENTARCDAHVVPFTDLARDLKEVSTTPNYVFITPDTCHDGHDAPCTAPPSEAGQPGGLTSADAFLATEVPKIMKSPAWRHDRSLLVITFDENGFSDVEGCCAPPAFGGRIGLVALDSAGAIQPGTVVHTTYNHWSYLRTVEDALGIGEHLNMAGAPTTAAMSDLFSSEGQR